MSDHLRTIAERFVAAYDGMESILGPVEGTHFAGPLDDAAKVCRAWLDDHPADDDEPVSEDWLFAMPGASKPHDFSNRIRVPAGEGVAADFTPWHPGWSVDVREVGPGAAGNTVCTGRVGLTWTLATRGDVRRLLRALGDPA